MNVTLKIKAPIDDEILRSLGIDETAQVDDEVTIEEESLWRIGCYDAQSLHAQLGHLFELSEDQRMLGVSKSQAESEEEKKIEPVEGE